VASSSGRHRSSLFRELRKGLIRLITGVLMRLPVHDLNSGLKLYRTDIAKSFLQVCPDSMAFSDVLASVFLHEHERPNSVRPRFRAPKSKDVATGLVQWLSGRVRRQELPMVGQ